MNMAIRKWSRSIFLYALLTQEDSLILKLIEKMEINKDYFIDVVKKALDAKVKVSGGRPEIWTVSEQGSG